MFTVSPVLWLAVFIRYTVINGMVFKQPSSKQKDTYFLTNDKQHIFRGQKPFDKQTGSLHRAFSLVARNGIVVASLNLRKCTFLPLAKGLDFPLNSSSQFCFCSNYTNS